MNLHQRFGPVISDFKTVPNLLDSIKKIDYSDRRKIRNIMPSCSNITTSNLQKLSSVHAQ